MWLGEANILHPGVTYTPDSGLGEAEGRRGTKTTKASVLAIDHTDNGVNRSVAMSITFATFLLPNCMENSFVANPEPVLVIDQVPW